MADSHNSVNGPDAPLFESPFAVTGVSVDLVQALCHLHLQAFPSHMQCEEPQRYFTEALEDPRHINIVMSAGDGDIVGYLLGIPQFLVFEELRRWDPLMQDDRERLYLDIIQVAPKYRGQNIALRLFQAICREAEMREMNKLSMHARTVTGLNGFLRRIFTEIRCLRRIDNWYGCGEPFDYMEATTAMRFGDLFPESQGSH